MEGVGAEVSHKIRSAIKAKLMELGAYVDDELPDYIMVMVANKRSKQQMETDLELFLTDNTSAFTTWLHQVLSKLQEVTVSLDKKSSSDIDKRKAVVPDDHRKEKEKKKKAKKEKDKEDEKSRPTGKMKGHDNSEDSSKMDLSNEINLNGLKKSESQSDSETKPPASSTAQDRTASSSKPSCQTDEDDDDFINLKADAETDLWEGEADDISLNSDMKDKESVKTSSRRTSETSKVDASEEQTKSAERMKVCKPGPSEWEHSPSPPVLALPPAPPTAVRPQTTSRIIKISEVLREEEETLNSSVKRSLDDKRIIKKPESSEVLSGKILAPSGHPPLASRLGRRHVEKVTRRRISDAGLSSRRTARKATQDSGRPSGRSARDDSGVASVIRVLPRPRRPAALQPSCSLILKAVAEAEKSVATARRPKEVQRSPLKSREVPVQAAPTLPPSTQTTAPPNTQKPKSKSPLFTRRFREKANLVRTVVNTGACDDEPMLDKDETGEDANTIPDYEDSIDERIENTRPETPKNILIQVSSSDRITSLQGVTDRSNASAVPGTSPQGVALPPPPPPQTSRMANVSRWLEEVEHGTDSTLDVDMEVDTDGVRNSRQDVEMDEGGSDLELGAGLDALDDDDADDDYDDDVGAGDDEGSRRNSSSKITPQFVVTLDGLDPLLLRSFGIDAQNDSPSTIQSPTSSNQKRHLVVQTQLDEEQQLRAQLLNQQATAAATKAKLRATSTGGTGEQLANSAKIESVHGHSSGSPQTGRLVEELPHVERDRELPRGILKRPASPITFEEPNSKKGKGGSSNTDSLTAQSKTVTPERCKFWPICRQGDLCEFHHPTVQCRLFPNCKFGDMCLYIHPNCRYDSACTRRDCPYTHSSHRVVPPPAVPSKGSTQLCKFFPRCTNSSCPFLHPKMCRFGAYCTKHNCLFAHEDKASSTKMKWVSTQQ